MAAVDGLLSHLSKIRTPLPGERVYKDECVFSFDTPESETGLYVCLNTFLGFSQKYVRLHYTRTGNAVFLHLKRLKREIPDGKENNEGKKKRTRLAIGLEGGFDFNEGKKYEYEEEHSIAILPDFSYISLPNPDLPESVQLSIASVLAADAASKMEEAQALSGTWDGEKRRVTKHASSLKQLNNGIKVLPKGWKCELCNKTDNLWLNLTDGAIHCGRRFFDGSGGNNHAIQHYEETSYPLVVKLGTITPDGGDVYSYDEDEMVEDPNLAAHLAHFGINITQMEKTDKSMVELELDMNQRIGEWAIIQEAGFKLIPLYGPGYCGLANLGNSCYLNSVMQVIFAIPDFQKRYYSVAEKIFENAPSDPTKDFNVQMAKLACGLLSGEYSKPPEDGQQTEDSQLGIKPQMFKNLIGRGHPEFSTKRQQDAQEFFLHLINTLERNNRNQVNPADCFKFQVEERIQCVKSGKVKYTTRTDYLLSLPIPLDSAVNKDEVSSYEEKKAEKEAKGDRVDPNEVVRPRVSLHSCLDAFAAPEIVDDFFSTALNSKSMAHKLTRLHTFPDYLMIQLKKFTISDDWIPKKLDVSVDVPDTLHLSTLRGRGLQNGEEELPEPKPDNALQQPEFEFDVPVLSQLCEMGFSVEGCKRALYNTQNGGVEAAMNWIMEHMNDRDFSSPFSPPISSGHNSAEKFSPNPEALTMIVSMGFTVEQATCALKATNNNVERAADWIFSHVDDLDPSPMDTDVSFPNSQFRDGSEKYKLVAFISHMGTSTMVGHYVCHILREGHWVIYNDNKVALSEHPPKDLSYLYLYQRE